MNIMMPHYGFSRHPMSDSYHFQTPSIFAGTPLRRPMLPGITEFDFNTVSMAPHHGTLLRTQSTLSESKEKYKTELCIPFMEHGVCEQLNCQFAHGEQDLRPVHRDSNYKTILCKNFHSNHGFCKHGSRCTYVHNEPLAVRLKRTTSQNGTSMLPAKQFGRSMSHQGIPLSPIGSPQWLPLKHIENRSRFKSTSDGESITSDYSSGGNSPSSHSPNMTMDEVFFDPIHVPTTQVGCNLPGDRYDPYVPHYNDVQFYSDDSKRSRSSRLLSSP